MSKFDRPIVLIGGGGHAAILADLLLRQGATIIAVIAPDEIAERALFAQLLRAGTLHYRQDNDIEHFAPESVYLVNGLGMMPKSSFRQRLNQDFLAKGYQFASVVASSAEISPFATLESGVQILAGAIVQAGAYIGAHSIINSAALVEHDCVIGAYNHLAPRATLCGQVVTGKQVYVGAGATVIQCLSLGDDAIVGAGAVVTHDLAAAHIAYPARSIIKKIEN
ncbi:acetyltransferase [Grimontia sp. S25]|uniref:Acetyltransferase n=1 Tax=Grimontia sedimenti TaxID=2711294 RepID=A0A6M1R8K9_9GAMM|nr:acetyltransferase [Grimontia sedimenti]NGN98473.1 acetyltransferase [Grimontia sedimenti]